MRRDAVFSSCGAFRYLLIRQWDASLPMLVFGLLNPSKAGAEVDDQTSRKGVGFAKALGYGGMVFFNLYAYCATDPRDLKKNGYQVGIENDKHILNACAMGDGTVICGWGANARGLSRPREVIDLIVANGYRPAALRLLPDGVPEHPLMLPYILKPEPMTGALYGLHRVAEGAPITPTSKRYGCHNRKPLLDEFATVAEPYDCMGTKRVPFIANRASKDCEYTKSDLGRVDKSCDGCKWRAP